LEPTYLRVPQEYVFDNLVQRYQLAFSFDSSETNVFAIYDLVGGAETYALTLQRLTSASAEALFTALRQSPNISDKDQFVAKLQTRVERGKASLRLTFTP
jgi:hypothetical protein